MSHSTRAMINKAILPLLVWLVCIVPACAQETNPAAKIHQQALKKLATILPRDHISQRPLDDVIAERWFELFLDRLDPRRLYFTEVDVRRFAEVRDNLDDHARRGDLSFAILVRKTYVQRVSKAMGLATAFLDQDHDFSIPELAQTKHRRFAADWQECRERWLARVKSDLLEERAAGLDSEQAINKLRVRYQRIARQRNLKDDADLYEIYLDAFARSFGPHCRYFGERTLASYRH